MSQSKLSSLEISIITAVEDAWHDGREVTAQALLGFFNDSGEEPVTIDQLTIAINNLVKRERVSIRFTETNAVLEVAL